MRPYSFAEVADITNRDEIVEVIHGQLKTDGTIHSGFLRDQFGFTYHMSVFVVQSLVAIDALRAPDHQLRQDILHDCSTNSWACYTWPGEKVRFLGLTAHLVWDVVYRMAQIASVGDPSSAT